MKRKKVYGGGIDHRPLEKEALAQLKDFLRAELEKDLVAVGGCQGCFESIEAPPGEDPIITAMCPVANKHCKRCNHAHGSGY